MIRIGEKNRVTVIFVIILFIVGVCGCIGEKNKPPTVNIFASSASGYQPLQVLFTTNATDPDGSIRSYYWDFGDGTISNQKNPNHTFYYGTYKAMLTVTDDKGAEISKNVTITVNNRSPTATASANPTSGSVPLTVTFSLDASDVDGSISSWKLDINNNGTAEYSGSGSPPPTQKHIYQSSGTYLAKLTVADTNNATTQYVVTIIVKPDSDRDGVSDDEDAFPYDPTEWKDIDGDGYGDNSDTFPYDPTEWKDSDNDGHGDNSDAFPHDPSEWEDTDGDGYGDNSDAFPHDPTEWKDIDGDGYGDNSDAFPYDSSEWADSDGDGLGDNSDSLPYDYDNDGFADSVDIDKYGDVAIKISIEKFNITDQLDFMSTSVEVFFEIYVNEKLEARIDNGGKSWVATVGQIYLVDEWIIYNIDDDQRYTNITIVMWDDDWPLENDLIDIDGHNETKALAIVFDAVTYNWSGDDDDGYTDGRDDGSWSYDDDDGILWYNIGAINIEYDKTYFWHYDSMPFSIFTIIPPETYAYYKHLDIDRSPFSYSEVPNFVTPDDDVIIEIANKLNSLAQNMGYDYKETANFVLRFVQSLEYTFDNETTPFNEYWRFSVETLVDETGDCEDTSILYASVMEAIGYDAVLIILPSDAPSHAAVGIAGDGYPGSYYTYDGMDYYYCETTGTGWDMGNIPQEYLGQLAIIIQVG